MSVVAGLSAAPAWSQQTQAQTKQAGGVTAGILTCNVASGWGFVFGSTRDLKCTFAPRHGTIEHYTGQIDKFGVDIGYLASSVIAWAVVAPKAETPKGFLTGTFTGVTGGAAFGVGASGNVLVGSGKTVSLQPLSVEGMAGVNVAAGIAQIELKAVQD